MVFGGQYLTLEWPGKSHAVRYSGEWSSLDAREEFSAPQSIARYSLSIDDFL